MSMTKGFGQILAMVGMIVLLYSVSYDSERFFDIPNGGIFLGIILLIVGIIAYMNAKKHNGMIHAHWIRFNRINHRLKLELRIFRPF